MSTFSIIDVETTGLRAVTNRIIEIGIIRVEDGKVVEKYQQLINPECRVPWFIERHTGISSDMVKSAPTFGEVMPKVDGLLKGSVFVAHNVGFDYSFVQAEYRRQGLVYESPRLCTVRLSRHLFPEHRRHGLDQIIERLGVDCPSRHRALDDAEVVWQFMQQVQHRMSPELLSRITT